MKYAGVVAACVAIAGIVGLAVACGGSSASDIVGSPNSGGAEADGSINNVGDGSASTDAMSGGGSDGSAKDGSTGPCKGIGCNKVDCGNGTPTSITGQVFDPAGLNPLYNVVVYIPADPKAPLPAFKKGASCDRCGEIPLGSVSSALTDENGKFTLPDVPVMNNVPVVVQVGKWRTKTTIDVTQKCQPNALPAKVTLPKKSSEGDMPQIAVTTGGCDALECLLIGMGIDQSEFVQGNDPSGHVHMYKGNGGTTGADAQTLLWNDASLLGKYDTTLLSCECDEHNENKTNMQALHDYLGAGGRVLATHYHYTWFLHGPQADFKGIAAWLPNGGGAGGPSYTIEQGFPKGHAYAQWLMNVNASTTLGLVPLTGVASDLTTVSMPASQAWIDVDANNVKLFSFNTPLGVQPKNQCGRAVYTDLHVAGAGGETFPSGCMPAPGAPLTAQQKALEFMLLDLTSCIQSDATTPVAPQ